SCCIKPKYFALCVAGGEECPDCQNIPHLEKQKTPLEDWGPQKREPACVAPDAAGGKRGDRQRQTRQNSWPMHLPVKTKTSFWRSLRKTPAPALWHRLRRKKEDPCPEKRF